MTCRNPTGRRPRLAVSIAVPCREWLRAVPAARRICGRAARAALAGAGVGFADAEFSLMLADDTTVAGLNHTYRGRDAPTDVLSFANSDLPSAGPLLEEPLPEGPLLEERAPVLLGDVVVAFETASADAAKQNTPLSDHLVHLVVHGALHLLGYDHEDEADASRMETVEIAVLAGLGIENPYSAEVQRSSVD
jgi:probable rRNA maturation factor